MNPKKYGICLIFAASLCFSCSDPSSVNDPSTPFDVSSLVIPDGGVPKIRGQVLYMPVYSSIPNVTAGNHNLSALVAVHNTDLNNELTITKVILCDTDGKVVKNYLPEPKTLTPLASAVFNLPKQDKSGPGANFLVEWKASSAVTAPLVESIIKDLAGNMGLSFLSTGKVIRELK